MSDSMQSWRILVGFHRYQRAAARTMPPLPKRDALQMLTLGLAGETGEVVDGVKKFLYHGHAELSKSVIVQELGDLLWYIANLASLYDLTLAQVAEFNIAKLMDRYPDGFSEDASRNRFELREENGQIGGVRFYRATDTDTPLDDEHNIHYGTDTL